MIKNLSNFLPFSGVSNFIYVLFESWRCCWLINIYSAISRKRIVKLWSYTIRFFVQAIRDLREILFHLLIDYFFILPWFDCSSYWNWASTRNVLYTTPERKKKTWNSTKNDWKFLFWAFFPNNIFPTFILLLKVTLNLLKTSLVAIILLFFDQIQDDYLNPYFTTN